MSPYLAVEAHLISCGGFATQGKGPFDVKKILAWLKKRSLKVMPAQPDFAAELVNQEMSNGAHGASNDSMLLPRVGRRKRKGNRNAAVYRSLDVSRINDQKGLIAKGFSN